MKKLKTLAVAFAATTLLLAGALVYLLASDAGEYSWEYYNAATDCLFEELAKTNVVEPQTSILITGIVGIPWAEGTDDIVDGNVGMPRKRYLRVLPDDSEVEVYVVTFFAPKIDEKAFVGLFRHYDSLDDQERWHVLSCSICHVPGMVVATYAFPKNDAKVERDAFVRAEMGTMAQVQNILDAMEADS